MSLIPFPVLKLKQTCPVNSMHNQDNCSTHNISTNHHAEAAYQVLSHSYEYYLSLMSSTTSSRYILYLKQYTCILFHELSQVKDFLTYSKIYLCPGNELFLGSFNILLLALPCLQYTSLEGPPKGEGKCPWFSTRVCVYCI